jgi:hypothetical protein
MYNDATVDETGKKNHWLNQTLILLLSILRKYD